MKKWMLVVVLVVGIMIGSLMSNPFQSDAQINIEYGWLKRDQSGGGYCFGVYGKSITFIKKASSKYDCR